MTSREKQTEYVWVVSTGILDVFDRVFKTRWSARLYVTTEVRKGLFNRQWYKIEKVEVRL